LVHSNIPELKLGLDEIVGQKGGELDELVPEILDKLVIDVGDPGFQFDGDVLVDQIEVLLLFQYFLYFDHVLIFQFAHIGGLFQQFISFLK
jgi:hypothetical protein